MALILSAATGNFNAGATWVGGVVPTVGDEARASTGHTITINVNTTCDEVSNAGSGIFRLVDGVTLTANVTSKSTTINRPVIEFAAASPAEGTIVGNVKGGTVTLSSGAINTTTGTLNITGNVISGTSTDANGVRNASTGSINITGNVTSSTTDAILNNSSGTVSITGNVTGSSSNAASAVRNVSTGTINLTGDAQGGTIAGAHGLNINTGTGTCTGNAVGGATATSYGIFVSTGSATITGTCTGGINGAGANLSSTGTIYIGRAIGNAYGPGNTSGLSSTVGASNASVGVIEIEGLEFGQYGMNPTSGTGIRLKKVSTNQAIFNYVDAGAAKTLVDATSGQMPAATDVRTGVSYASGALTGTCAVPPAGSVALGVPVDAGFGTAALTPASVWDHLLSAITTSSTIGTLLKTNIDATISSRSTLTAANVRTELTPELTEITEVHAIHGLDIANALTVTPTLRSAGAITQAITGDGTTSTIVTRV